MQEFDNRFPLIQSYAKIKAAIEPMQKQLDSLNKEIKESFNIGTTIIGNYVVTISKTADIPVKIITESMIGQEIKGRKGSLVLRVGEKPITCVEETDV